MALRMAFISALPTTANFLVVDEGFGSADSHNIPRAAEMLKTFCRQYKFLLVITHIESIQQELSRELRITLDPHRPPQLKYGAPIEHLSTPSTTSSQPIPQILSEIADLKQQTKQAKAQLKPPKANPASPASPASPAKKPRQTDKPYKCACGESYTTSNYLTRHKLKCATAQK